MSADGSVELVWANETRKFRIAIGEFRNLQESVNTRRIAIGAELIGPASILASLRTNNAWPDDVRDVLKVGLIGAGMAYQKAQALLVGHFDNKPLLEHTKIAFLVLLAALVGVPDDESAKKKDRSSGKQKRINERDEPVRFSLIYGNGAAIGFSPKQVDECSFWQMRACIHGYNKANGAKDELEPPTDEEFDDMIARLT